MADQKISELTALTGANVADDDAIAIVDTSATETKKIVFSELKNALDTATGFVRITGDTMTGNLSMGDNVKAIFGAGSDLQIYHDGFNSYIDDAGAGDLYIRANNLRLANADGSEATINTNNGGSVLLHYAGSQKLITTSTGIDVTGTVTADGLTVGAASLPTITLQDTDVSANAKIEADNNGTLNLYAAENAGTGILRLYTAGVQRLRAANNGDISFYEDTGTTPKFFWDASAKSLGIGTSSPTAALDVRRVDADGKIAEFHQSTGYGFTLSSSQAVASIESGFLQDFVFKTGSTATERMRIDSSGNVGIGDGTLSHTSMLHIYKSLGTADLALQSAGSSGRKYILQSKTDGSLAFYDNNASTERMRIDSSGNVGIGTDSPVNNSNRATLGLQGVWGGQLDIMVGSTVHAQFGTDNFSTGLSARIQSQDGIVFKTNGNNESMRIKSDGHVQINGQLHFTDTGSLIARPTTNALSFNTNGSEAMRIDSSGHAIIPAGVTLGTSAGVYNAAKTLDDYEEGTWTPSPSLGSLNVSSAKYIKVGTLVTIFLDFTVTTGGGSVIAGLPFSAQATVGFTPYQSAQDIIASRSYLTIAVAGTNMYVRSSGDNVAFAATGLTAGAVFHMSFSYQVA
jgi:hypothetical protein